MGKPGERHNTMTYAIRAELCSFKRAHPGTSHSDLLHWLRATHNMTVSLATISKTLKRSAAILEASPVQNSAAKRAKKQQYPKLEEALFQWVAESREKGGGSISGEALKEKGRQLLGQLYPNASASFKFSDGWLWNFRRRYNMTENRDAISAARVHRLLPAPHPSSPELHPRQLQLSTVVLRNCNMKAVEISAPGGPEVLRVVEVEAPIPKKGEVLLTVAAAGLNRADIMQRQGKYPPPPGASPYPGLECSGTIEFLGEGVTGWKVGDQVCALLDGGGYAERVVVPASQLLPIPKGVSLIEAAALPEVACTVWSTVFMTSNLKEGENFLVHGGSSGIGTFAIQLAKAKGARVFCTAGTPEKLHRCKELGADVTINYREEEFVDRVKEETAGKGADVILDNMGGPYLARNIRALATGGRLFVIGLQGGRGGDLDCGALLMKRLSIASAGLRSRPPEQKAGIVAEVLRHVWPEVAAGRVLPVVHCALPLAEAAAAHALMEGSTHVGKILLKVPPPNLDLEVSVLPQA